LEVSIRRSKNCYAEDEYQQQHIHRIDVQLHIRIEAFVALEKRKDFASK